VHRAYVAAHCKGTQEAKTLEKITTHPASAMVAGVVVCVCCALRVWMRVFWVHAEACDTWQMSVGVGKDCTVYCRYATQPVATYKQLASSVRRARQTFGCGPLERARNGAVTNLTLCAAQNLKMVATTSLLCKWFASCWGLEDACCDAC